MSIASPPINEIAAAALAELGIEADTSDGGCVIHVSDPKADPKLCWKAMNLARQAHGLEAIPFADWLAMVARRPYRREWMESWGHEIP